MELCTKESRPAAEKVKLEETMGKDLDAIGYETTQQMI